MNMLSTSKEVSNLWAWAYLISVAEYLINPAQTATDTQCPVPYHTCSPLRVHPLS